MQDRAAPTNTLRNSVAMMNALILFEASSSLLM